MILSAPGSPSTVADFGSATLTGTAFADVRKRALLSLKVGAAVLCLLSACYFSWRIALVALGVRAPTVQQGLYPEWLGAQEVSAGRSPYRPEVTERIQATIYGRASVRTGNEQRFAYPVYSALLFLPLAVLPFAVAQYVCLAACLVLALLSVRRWAFGREISRSQLLVAMVGVFSTYPAILGLQLRQPSLLIAGLLSVVYYWARSGRLAQAGMLAALCTSKPQLAVAVLLPLSIWAMADWHGRKRFLVSLGGSMGTLLLVSEIVVPGWFGQWLATMRAYSHYAGSAPLLSDLLRGHFVWPAGVLLLVASLWVSYRFCESDLLFAISCSIAVFQLVFPFLLYNEILLIPVALWLLRRPRATKPTEQLFELLWGCSWALLAIAAAAMFGLTVANLVVPGSGLKLWQVPFVMAWLYPWSVLLALSSYVVSRPANGCLAKARS
jgi:hypothetical protein